MQRILLGLVVAIALSACSKDDKKGTPAAPPTPDRKTEHKQDQCPADIVGSYQEAGDASNVFEIVISGGILHVIDAESGDIPVNGTPSLDKDDKSNSSIICKGGVLELNTNEVDGSKSVSIISKTATGLHVKFTDDKGFTGNMDFTRTGAPTSPTEDVLEIPEVQETGVPQERGRPELELELGGVPEIEETKTCNGGFEVSYQYSETRNNVKCDTGKRVYCSLAEYCSGLKDEALNKGCGKDKRERDYAAMCK